MQNAKSNVIEMRQLDAGLENLKKPVDAGLVKQREGWRDRNGNVHYVSYVEWHAVADILDRETPDWSQTVKEIQQIGSVVCVICAITIGGVTREGIGTGTAESEMGIKKAEHDALKRAAVKFGVARELYKKESELIEREGAAGDFVAAKPANPLARDAGDLITAKQLGMIRALGRERGIDPDAECQTELGCRTDELSKRAASYLIHHLQELSPQIENPIREDAASANDELKQSAAWRDEMEKLLKEVEIDPTNWLARYDSRCPQVKDKEFAYQETMKAVRARRRQMVVAALAGQNWDAEEIERELAKYEITDGLNQARDELVEKMWRDYRGAKML